MLQFGWDMPSLANSVIGALLITSHRLRHWLSTDPGKRASCWIPSMTTLGSFSQRNLHAVCLSFSVKTLGDFRCQVTALKTRALHNKSSHRQRCHASFPHVASPKRLTPDVNTFTNGKQTPFTFSPKSASPLHSRSSMSSGRFCNMDACLDRDHQTLSPS